MAATAVSSPTPSTRLHDLDAMRSVLMMLGVVLHGANPYRPQSSWLVRDDATAPVLTLVVDAIHLFRMPAFFVVAGYFAMHSLMRRSTEGFLRDRLGRTMVPFVTALILLNLPQTWLLLDPPRAELFLATLREQWVAGRTVGHLWFLVNLALYCAAAAACAGPLRHLATSRWPNRLASPWQLRGVLSVAVLAGLAVAVVDYLGPAWLNTYLLGLVYPIEWLDYAPFFILGLVLYGRSELLSTFASPGILDLFTTGIALVAQWALRENSTTVAGAVALTLHWYVVWNTVRLCFWVFRTFASRPSRTFRYLSDASYTIYLFHHLVVVLVASALLPLSWPALVKFAIVVVLTILSTLIIHHFVILKHPRLQWLFNGRPIQSKTS
jgi:glucan biosynthesis protein C